MEGSDWFDQKAALFIADTLDLSERLRKINQKILKQVEAIPEVLDSQQEEAQPKQLSDDQSVVDGFEALDNQLRSDNQTQQHTNSKVIYLLLPSHLPLKDSHFSQYQDEE